MADRHARLVYSTSGSVCPKCGWPADRCVCSRTTAQQSVPSRVVARLRIEKSGRGGKTVTVVYDLPRNGEFLRTLARELKQACGTGGSATEDTVEIQGDHRERIRPLLVAKGWIVKG
jgi:translation initiation factor 1